MPIYPVGIQTFSSIREGGFIYVDKTDLIYNLVRNSGYYFLSRPRRFGKSLLLSTIEAYFQGRRDLFKGLAIDSLTEDWAPHPVLHLDLNPRKYDTPESLQEELNKHLEYWESIYGDEKKDRSVEERFSYVIRQAAAKSGKKVVILIDEYDKPMLNSIGDEKLTDSFRSTLKAFYGNLKSMDAHIRFAMLTGVARFSKVSIFSDLNNLNDISLSNKYASICGITQEELLHNFRAGINELSERLGLSYDETVATLKSNYDGYHFAADCPDIYNPFSILSAFDDNRISNYWFASGTATFLVRLLEKRGMPVRLVSGFQIDPDTLANTGILSHDPIVSLYQTGYITIKGYDPEADLLTLDYPNREVKESFLKFLVPFYTSLPATETAFQINRFATDVREGNPQRFMERLSSLIAKVPYGGKGSAPEDHFQNAMYLVFTLLGYRVSLEDRTSGGRIDMTVETDGYVYIFEFKVNASARQAMDQIRSRGYWKGFGASDKKIFLVAANFSSESRTIDDYLIEEL